MLTFPDLTIEQQTQERGLQASTFVSQPFWQELQKYMYEMVEEALSAMKNAENASDETKARLFDRWNYTQKLVARIERIPQLAIEAARELGGNYGR